MLVHYIKGSEDINTIVTKELKHNDYVISLTNEVMFRNDLVCLNIHNDNKFRGKEVYKISKFIEIMNILISADILNSDELEYLYHYEILSNVCYFIYKYRAYQYGDGRLMSNILSYFDLRKSNDNSICVKDFMYLVFKVYRCIIREEVSTIFEYIKYIIKEELEDELNYNEDRLTEFMNSISIYIWRKSISTRMPRYIL